MSKKKIQWHPAMVAAVIMELKDNENDLHFEREYNLSKKPLQMDVLIVKKNRNAAIKSTIGKMFRKHNIIEYKSPDDEMGVDTFFKTIGYACLYKSSSLKENAYKTEDITITLIRHRFPKVLMSYLTDAGYVVHKQYDGIYYVDGLFFNVQIIVSKEISGPENVWLRSLQPDISKEDYQCLLESIGVLATKEREEYGESILEAVSKANESSIEKWKEESEMCATLEKIMEPELKERELKGRVQMCAELGLSLEDISKKVSLSVEDVKKILEQ
ncbi:MAG: hypothetical protein J6A03_13835 [Lachnospiraceae bacterium]|nr:hypothetical protein [Lachnospiraceae bacterium]